MPTVAYQAGYEVQIGTKGPLFRLVSVQDHLEIPGEDFESNAARQKRRRADEDAADYHSVSCFDTHKQAFENAMQFDPNGRRWRGVAELSTDGNQGHAYANTYEPGHWSVWAEPEELRQRVERVRPIGF